MPQIPVGNLGFRGMDRQLKPRVDAAAMTAPARALEQVGGTVMNIAADAIDVREREETANDRLTAAKFSLDYEQKAQEVSTNIVDRLNRGELKDEDEAREAFQVELGALDSIEMPKIRPAVAADLQFGLSEAKAKSGDRIEGVLRQSRVNRAEATYAGLLDGMGKEAANPAADLSLIGQRIEMAAEQAVAGGMARDRATALAQTAKDNTWYQHGNERLIRGKSSMQALNQLEQDLSTDDGLYREKLDTDRRNTLLNQVLNAKDRLQAKAEAATAKRETKAAGSLEKMRQVIASGFPVSDELRQKVAAETRGTRHEVDYREALQEERDVATFLRQPVAKQQKFLIDAERSLRAGGVSDPKELALLGRLSTTFNNNIKRMGDEPMEWNEARGGDPMPRITMADLSRPDGLQQLGATLEDRVSTLRATKQQFGDVVGSRPLFREEAAELGAALKAMSPSVRARSLGQLAKMVDDPVAFQGIVKQTLGDDPVSYAAGLANGFNFHTSAGRKVGDLIEQGALVLRDKSVIVPSKGAADDGSRAFFNQEAGDAIPPGSQQRDVYYQSALAIYAKIATEEGALGKELDKRIFRRAMQIATGGIHEVRGQKIVAPRYGMAEEDMVDALNLSLRQAADANGLDYGDLLDMKLVPDDRRPGRYFLMQDGMNYQPGKDGRPLSIEVK